MLHKPEAEVYSFNRFLSVKKQIAEKHPHVQISYLNSAKDGRVLGDLQIQHREQERRKRQKEKGHNTQTTLSGDFLNQLEVLSRYNLQQF